MLPVLVLVVCLAVKPCVKQTLVFIIIRKKTFCWKRCGKSKKCWKPAFFSFPYNVYYHSKNKIQNLIIFGLSSANIKNLDLCQKGHTFFPSSLFVDRNVVNKEKPPFFCRHKMWIFSLGIKGNPSIINFFLNEIS